MEPVALLDLILLAFAFVLCLIAAFRTDIRGVHPGWIGVALAILTLLTP